jgi:hypothetical protein
MKKTPTSKPQAEVDELQPEYRFDYRKARPNRFANRKKENRVVVLDPDVAQVFTTTEAVNNVLRALIDNMPMVKKQADAD